MAQAIYAFPLNLDIFTVRSFREEGTLHANLVQRDAKSRRYLIDLVICSERQG